MKDRTEVTSLLASDDQIPLSVGGSGKKTGSRLPRRFSDHTLENSLAEDGGATRKISNMQCLMHIMKGMIGTGILAMPVAYKNGGLWTSFAVIFVMGIACTWCMHMLVSCGEEMSRRTGRTCLDYATVVELAFETRGGRVASFSKVARLVVNLFINVTQLGTCCIYTLFVAQNLQQAFESIDIRMSDRLFIVIVSVFLCLYVMIRSIKTLAAFSTVANLLSAVGFLIILVAVVQDVHDVSEYPAFASFSTLPLFFGQAAFAFEGIALVLPLWNNMKDRHAFSEKAGVLNLGLTITVCLYQAVGFYGYLRFGDDVKGSITLNLPNNNGWFVAVKIMFAISLFITYGIQYYVPINIIWPGIVDKCREKNIRVPPLLEYVFRIAIVCVTSALSALVPHLDLLISLNGAFAISTLSLLLPAMTELVAFDCGVMTWMKNVFILFFALLGFLTGTYSSMVEIIKAF